MLKPPVGCIDVCSPDTSSSPHEPAITISYACESEVKSDAIIAVIKAAGGPLSLTDEYGLCCNDR